MAKSAEELKALQEELESVADKLSELTEDELISVTGGAFMYARPNDSLDGIHIVNGDKTTKK